MHRKADIIGEIGELAVIRELDWLLPDDIQICWTRLAKPNCPFDLILWTNGQTLACIEVKTLAQNRKHYWTQYKRPAIRRKMKYASDAGCGLVFTVAVRLDKPENDIRFIAGLPSIPVDRFEPDLKLLVQQF
jgi:hypothetical protein